MLLEDGTVRTYDRTPGMYSIQLKDLNNFICKTACNVLKRFVCSLSDVVALKRAVFVSFLTRTAQGTALHATTSPVVGQWRPQVMQDLLDPETPLPPFSSSSPFSFQSLSNLFTLPGFSLTSYGRWGWGGGVLAPLRFLKFFDSLLTSFNILKSSGIQNLAFSYSKCIYILSIFVCSLSGHGLAPTVLLNFYIHHSVSKNVRDVSKGGGGRQKNVHMTFLVDKIDMTLPLPRKWSTYFNNSKIEMTISFT